MFIQLFYAFKSVFRIFKLLKICSYFILNTCTIETQPLYNFVQILANNNYIILCIFFFVQKTFPPRRLPQWTLISSKKITINMKWDRNGLRHSKMARGLTMSPPVSDPPYNWTVKFDYFTTKQYVNRTKNYYNSHLNSSKSYLNF